MVFLLTWDVEPPGVLRGRVRESSGPCGFPQFVCEVRTHMVVGTGDPARPQLGPWRGLRDEWVMASREFRMADWGLGSGGCAHQVVQGSDWAASKGLWRDSGGRRQVEGAGWDRNCPASRPCWNCDKGSGKPVRENTSLTGTTHGLMSWGGSSENEFQN